ncbi:MAG: cytoplasmic protein [Bacteroidota bacterium]
MKGTILTVSKFLFVTLALCLGAQKSQAQDPTKVDPKHYTVVFENDQVRVLRIKYGVHEKSVMHEHPDGVAVYLTDSKVKMTLPDGKTVNVGGKAGEAVWAPAGAHLPENVGKKPFELIQVELKGESSKNK